MRGFDQSGVDMAHSQGEDVDDVQYLIDHLFVSVWDILRAALGSYTRALARERAAARR